jgi:hypothetical protein
MNLLEFLSALGGAIGELEDLSMIARDYATRPWNVSRITLGEDQFHASILGGWRRGHGDSEGRLRGHIQAPNRKSAF